MTLINKLSKVDYNRFENYVCTFGVARKNYCGNEQYLRFWDKNKINLFKLLGNQLIYEMPHEFESKYAYADTLDFMEEKENVQFFAKLKAAAYKNGCPVEATRFITRQHNICKNSIDWFTEVTLDTMEDKKPVKISECMRYTKALAKFIEYYDLHDFKKEFEKYRIRHSMLLASFKVKGVLCLSIHPLDFVTMSDNANDWSSCMSWSNDGCYKAGTVEMMNSKYAVVAYLKSENKVYNFGKNNNSEEYQWNSKQYRQLFYIDEDFLLSGKSYPYRSDELTEIIFDKLLELAKTNCGWIYKNNYSYNWERDDVKFITDMMYNDILNAIDYDYKIAHNFSDGCYINLSGPAPCLVCGECHVLEERDYDDIGYDEDSDSIDEVAEFYNSRYETTESLICRDCKSKTVCGECLSNEAELSATIVDEVRFCRNCWNKHVRINPLTGELFTIFNSSYSDEFSDFQLYMKVFGDDYECISAEGDKYVRLWLPYETLRDLIREGHTTTEAVKSVNNFWRYDIYILNENSGIDAEALKFKNLVTPEFVGLNQQEILNERINKSNR